MDRAKIQKGKFSNNVVIVNFKLEFSVSDETELSPIQVKKMINDMDRTDLGEIVLNHLKWAYVETNSDTDDMFN